MMSFPQTRLTLIQRLASGGSEEDWDRFLRDYWGPVCRFSLRRGARNLDDAEDVASETFELLWEKRLLDRWVSNRSAKLRTLLCAVVRNVLSHRNRVRAGREQRLRDLAEQIDKLNRAPDEQVDAFYAAWVEDLMQRSVEALAAEYYRQSKDDYVRVLYGRLCQGLTIAKVAEALEIKPTAVVNYFRHAQARLSEKLEELVRRQVQCYCPAEQVAQEFAVEWQQLGRYLTECGGLEKAVRRAYELLDPVQVKKHKGVGLTKAVTRLTSIIRTSSGATPSKKTT